MDSVIGSGALREMIIVRPDASNRYVGCHYANSIVTGNWEDFIVRELVAHIDRTYRTLATPASRGLAGHSMGGRGALYLASKYPNVYGALYALSSGRMAFEAFPPFDEARVRSNQAMHLTARFASRR